MINFKNIKIINFEKVFESLNEGLDKLGFYINGNGVDETVIVNFFNKIFNFYTDNTIIFWSIFLFLFLLNSIGLFLISKKIGEDNSFLAFFPILQIHTYIQISKKSFLTYFFLPFILIIFGLFFSPYTFGASLVFATIISLALYIDLSQAMARRIGRGFWLTMGFSFLPFIFFPLFGKRL